MTEPAPSPLTEVDEFSLDELWFRIDRKLVAGLPQDITDPDIDAITTRLRAARDKFVQSELVKSQQPKRPRGAVKTPATPIVIGEITF